jgi:hypothetical protein
MRKNSCFGDLNSSSSLNPTLKKISQSHKILPLTPQIKGRPEYTILLIKDWIFFGGKIFKKTQNMFLYL